MIKKKTHPATVISSFAIEQAIFKIIFFEKSWQTRARYKYNPQHPWVIGQVAPWETQQRRTNKALAFALLISLSPYRSCLADRI
jgi:hypothetical protein